MQEQTKQTKLSSSSNSSNQALDNSTYRGKKQHWNELVGLTLQDVGRAHVDLGHHNKDGNVECKRQAQVLLGHSNNPSITANLHQGYKLW